MSINTYLHSQFHKPTGVVGMLAGMIMAHRPSNRLRNEWVIDLLQLPLDARVLEIGFGPGYAIERLAERCPEGKVVGIDHSTAMVRFASKRNRIAIERGIVELRQLAMEEIDAIPGKFDRIIAVNAYHFWKDRTSLLAKLRTRLSSHGRLAIAVQPRAKGADDEMARRIAAGVEREMLDAGFNQIYTHERELSPLVVCTIGC